MDKLFILYKLFENLFEPLIFYVQFLNRKRKALKNLSWTYFSVKPNPN